MSFRFDSRFFLVSTFLIINIAGISFVLSENSNLIQDASADTATAEIKVVKVTDIPESGTFDFSFTLAGGSLTGTSSIVTSSGMGMDGPNIIPTGIVTIQESATPGWSLVGAGCEFAGGGGSQTFDAVDTITLDADLDDIIQCTFENERDKGVIKVIKEASGGDDTLFGFDVTGPTTLATQFANAGDQTPSVSFLSVVKTGTGYSVTETIPASWTQMSVSCVGSLQGAVDSANFEVQKDEIVTCTFINEKDPSGGTIYIVKQTTGGDNTFNFDITDGPDAPISVQLVTSGGSATDSIQNVAAGTYSINEVPVPADWTLTSANCVGSTGGEGTSGATGVTGFVVNDDDIITCTFENAKAATLTVIKNLITTDGGDETASDWTIDISDSSNPSNDNFPASASGTTVTVDPGAYSVDETGPGGYVKTLGGDCTGTIAAGEEKTCTITNDDIAPEITLIKSVTNDDGGDETAGGFDLLIDAGVAPQGFPQEVMANQVITIEEYLAEGYAFESILGTGCPAGIGTPDGEVTLTEGESIICTITNNDIAPMLKLVKTVTNDDGGNEMPDDWTLFATGGSDTSRDFSTLGGSGTFETVLANEQYALSESIVAGYTAGTWDCEESGSISLDLAETVTCTINNDDIAPTITVEKVLINVNGGSATLSDFNLAINGDVVGHGGSATAPANVGTNTVSETEIAGYDLIGISGTKCPTTNGGTVTPLDEGENITCTFTNQGVGTIQIHKESRGGDHTFDFEITSSGGSSTINELITTGGSATGPGADTFLGWGVEHDVIAAQYTITETMNNGIGWTIDSIDCGLDEVSQDLGSQSVVVDVNPGDTVECTFANEDLLEPIVTVPANFRVEDDGATVGDVFNPLSAADAIDPSPSIPTCTVGEGEGTIVITSPDDIPGTGTHTVTCESTDLAGNTGSSQFDVTLMEITLDAASSFKFDHSQFDGSGEVFGSVGTDLVEIVVNHPVNGETVLLSDITITGGDMDGTWSFTGETLPADNIDENTIQARLIADNPGIVATSGGDDTFAVLPHDISVKIVTWGGDDTGVPWDNSIRLDVIVTDNDFIASEDSGDLGENAAHEICYSDIGVAGDNTQCFTLEPDVNGIATTGGDDTVQAGIADNVGINRNVVATFDLADAVTEYGNSPVTNEDGNNPFSLDLEPHDISVQVVTCGGDDTGVKWDHTLCLDTIVTDNDFVVGTDSGDLGENAAHEICYSDKGVAGENVQCFTLEPDVNGIATTGGDDTVQAGIADDAGNARNVVATFDLADAVTEYGNSPVTNEDGNNPFSLNLEPHVTTLPLNPLIPTTIAENKFSAIGILTDFDRILSDSPEAKVNFDTGNPSFAKSTSSTLEGQLISFDGDSDLTFARTGGITITDSGASFAKLHGVNVLQMKKGGVIEFSNVPTVSIDFQNIDIGDFVVVEATTGGTSPETFQSIATGVDLDPFPEWTDATNYFEDDSVVKIDGTPDRFYVAKIDHTSEDGTNNPPTSTTPPDLDENTFWKEITVNRDFVNFLATVDDGIARVEIINITRADQPEGTETADVSGLEMLEPRGSPPEIFEVNFDNIAELNPALLHLRGIANTNTFGAGTYFGVATASSEAVEDNEVSASFIPVPGTNAYLGSSSGVDEYDVIDASWGEGSETAGLVPDSGVGFTGKECGSDPDKDGLCSGLETTGANIIKIDAGFGNANIEVPVLEGIDYRDGGSATWDLPTRAKADIYLELDVMAPLTSRLDTNALGDLQKAFESSPFRNEVLLDAGEDCSTNPNDCGIRVHIFVDEEIPKIDRLDVWQDFDTNPDDFAHLKSIYFNTPDNRAELNAVTGSQTSTFVQKALGLNHNDDGDCTDGTDSFIGDPTDGVADVCFDGVKVSGFEGLNSGFTEFVDEDAFDGVNNDMDCTVGTNHFIGDNTDGVADACYDSSDEVVDDRIFFTGNLCSNANASIFYSVGVDNTDGMIDDCFDENNDLRTAVTELIDEDYVEDQYAWIIDGIVLQTPQDDLYTSIKGRIIVEEQVVFDSSTKAKIEGSKKWIADPGVPDTVYKNLRGQMLNSISEDSTTANAFIFRSEWRFDAIDTNTVDANGVDTGNVEIKFDVPAGTNVLGATNSPWRISPDVITSEDEGRASYYHYGIVADSIGACGPSGIAEVLGNDLIISLGCGFDNEIGPADPENNNQPQTVGSRQQQANALMHELGHNLDLLHGGPRINQTTGIPILDANINCKPNYDSTMSYTHQSTAWLPSTYKPHYSSGLIQIIDETDLPPEADGLKSKQDDGDNGRRIVFAAANGDVKTDRVTEANSTPDLINWDGTGATVDPGAVDVNFIPGLTGCEASPGQRYDDHDDWNNLNLIWAGEGVAFDGISACTTCINDYTSENDQQIIDALEWYDGLLRHNQLSQPPNLNIFTQVINQEVVSGQNLDASFQFFNCNPNNTFDEDPQSPTYGQRIGTDLCIDENKIVKRLGYYSETQDGLFINDDEVQAGAEGEEVLTALTGKTMFITLTRACAELPVPVLGTGICPASADMTPYTTGELGPFHEHSDGVTSWYHFGVDTTDIPLGHYKAEITFEEEGSDPRMLSDYNKKIFNPATGNFQPGVFLEYVPEDSITGFDDEGSRVTFLVNIVEAP